MQLNSLKLRIVLLVSVILLICLYSADQLLLSQAILTKLTAFFSFFGEKQFWIYAIVGFGAQTIDGALGMAYGVSSTTFLLAAGVGPAEASASVHIAEIFTAGISGFSHHKLGNVNKKLFRRLVFPGVIGGILGAFLSTTVDGKWLTPFIAGYLLIMGFVIIYKAFKNKFSKQKTKRLFPLALFGGFADAIGGGGWGPIVNSTLLSSGWTPRYAIGSVNLAEFYVAFFTALAFSVFLGLNEWENLRGLTTIIAGLIFGGIFAAPFAGYLCKKLKAKTLLLLVGILIILLSTRTLWSLIK